MIRLIGDIWTDTQGAIHVRVRGASVGGCTPKELEESEGVMLAIANRASSAKKEIIRPLTIWAKRRTEANQEQQTNRKP